MQSFIIESCNKSLKLGKELIDRKARTLNSVHVPMNDKWSHSEYSYKHSHSMNRVNFILNPFEFNFWKKSEKKTPSLQLQLLWQPWGHVLIKLKTYYVESNVVGRCCCFVFLSSTYFIVLCHQKWNNVWRNWELITGCSDSENGEWNFDLLTFSMKSKRTEKEIQNEEPANDECSVEVKTLKLSQNINYGWEVEDFYFQGKSTIAINWILM